MHRGGERGANRAGAGFFREQHRRKHDDENRADIENTSCIEKAM